VGNPQRRAAKFIRPFHISSVRIDRGIITSLLAFDQTPDGIVAYKDAWLDEDSVVILMKEHQNTLRRWIGHNFHLTDEEWLAIIFGIVTGLAYFHNSGIPHKDLKPSNSLFPPQVEFTFTVLIDRTPDGRFLSEHIYVSDWGLPVCSHFPVRGRAADVSGTYLYLAPEVYKNGEEAITTRSDMWAVGCIGYELCVGQKLATNSQHLENYRESGDSSPVLLNHLMNNVPTRFSSDINRIIRTCLSWDPQQRCSAVNVRDYIRQLREQRRAHDV
jgi:serine/threonine protein kinase